MLLDLLKIIITKIDPNQISTKEIHFYGFLAYFFLLFIYFIFLFKIRNNFVAAGQWNQGLFAKSFFLSIIGLIFLIFNFFITKLYLYLTNGEYSIFYQEKGIFAQLGFTIFFMAFPYCGLIIINISDKAKKITKLLLSVISIIIISSLVISLLSLFKIFSFEQKITMGLLSFFLCLSLFTSISLLINELKTSFSKINKVRIQILIIGLVFILLDVLFIMFGFFIQYYSIDFFSIWNNVIQPIQRFFFYSFSILCLYYGFFFPLWLQEKTGVLPPSFSKLIEKRNYAIGI